MQDIKVAVDAVVFGYQQQQLWILLIKQRFGPLKDSWVLPGGFVLNHESLQTAVQRELQEEAGIAVDYLEQLYTFGDDIDRDPRFRVVSVAYMALVNPEKFTLVADTDAAEANWFCTEQLPKLGFDHAKIVQKGLERIRNKISYQPIGFELLPEKFLFSDLEHLYATLSGKELDRRNFRKKIMSFGLVEETSELSNQKGGRPARLFRFNKDKYQQLLQQGFYFEV